MLTTGTVQLSLADVDQMRDKIKTAEEAVKKKDIEIADLRAKQREVLITESELGRTHRLDINVYALISKIRDTLNRRNYPEFGIASHHHSNTEVDIIRAVNDYVKPVYSNPEVKNKYYKNLDDIQEELRLKLEKEYEDRLRDMGSQVKACDEKVTEAKSLEMKKYEEMRKHLQKMIDEKNEYIENLHKKVTELETGKREQTENEKLREDADFWKFAFAHINNQIFRFVEKPWLKRMFSSLNETISIEALRKAFEKSRAEKGEQ